MKYISRVYCGSEEYKYVISPVEEMMCEVTDSGVVTQKRCREIPYTERIQGSVLLRGQRRCFLVYDEKAMKLLSYVKRIWSLQSHLALGRSCNKDSVCVKTNGIIFDHIGSDIVRIGSGSEKLMTMYDMLGEYCRQMGTNLMLHKEVYIGTIMGEFWLGMEMSDSDEAKRFFTKMYMDVSRCNT